jgi:hypothetical protein
LLHSPESCAAGRTTHLGTAIPFRSDLAQLDAAEYEEAPGLPHAAALQDAASGGLQPPSLERGAAADQGSEAAQRDAELIDSRTHRFQIAHRVSAEEMRRRQRLARQGEMLGGGSGGTAGGWDVGGPEGLGARGAAAPLAANLLWRRHSHEV